MKRKDDPIEKYIEFKKRKERLLKSQEENDQKTKKLNLQNLIIKK